VQLEIIEGLFRDQVDAWWRCEKITGVLQIGNVDLLLEDRGGPARPREPGRA
jgi:hypothetical protein